MSAAAEELDYLTREGARLEQARVSAVPEAECSERSSHVLEDDGQTWCRAGECDASHFTECEGCGEFSVFVVGDGAPSHHEDCEPAEVDQLEVVAFALRMARAELERARVRVAELEAEQARAEAQATADALDAGRVTGRRTVRLSGASVDALGDLWSWLESWDGEEETVGGPDGVARFERWERALAEVTT